MTQAVYLVVGEAYLAEEVLDRIRADEETDPLSEATFDATTEMAEILEALTTSSLLGGRRLVVIRDAEDLNKEQATSLTAYLESPSPDSVLILLSSGRSKLDAAAKKAGTVVTLEAPKGRRLVGWLRERARAKSLKLDERGAWALIDAVGADLRELDGSLEQLGTRLGEGATIGVEQVRRAFPRLADERIFAFTDAVGERKLDVAMTALRRLLEQGDEPLMVFGALTSHVRRLLRARRHADAGARAVGDALGLPEWRAERVVRQARSYREDELVTALGLLSVADLDMKGEFPSPEAALERAVVRLISG